MTTTPMPVTCPHCGATNAYGAAFCESCGKALPPPMQTAPRVLYGNQAATTRAGVAVQTEELKTQAKKAAQALLLVAVLTTLGALVIAGLVFSMASRPDRVMIIGPPDAVINLVVAAIFWGLYFWARKNPLPAAIVGLVLYVTLTILQFVMMAVLIKNVQDQQARQGYNQGRDTNSAVTSSPLAGGGCGIWLRVLIIVMLVQGITAGVKHRKLVKQQQQQAGEWESAPPPMPGYAAPPGPPTYPQA